MLDHTVHVGLLDGRLILRLGVTISLLMAITPRRVLALFALPAVATATWRPGVERVAQEYAAPFNRLARHLFVTATTAPPGKEVRVTGIGDRLIAERRFAWQTGHTPVARARWGSAAWHTLAWAVFGAGYVGAVVFVALRLKSSAGSVLLVLAAGSRLSAYIGATVGEIGFLRGFWSYGAIRLVTTRRRNAVCVGDVPVPSRITTGVSPTRVSVPRHDRLVLDDVNLRSAAGAIVAIIGENGQESPRRRAAPKCASRRAVAFDRQGRVGAHARRRGAPLTGADTGLSLLQGRRWAGDVPRLDDERSR